MELRPDAAAPRVTPGAPGAGCCCTCRTRARTCPRGSARTSCPTTRSSPPRSRRSPTTAPTRSRWPPPSGPPSGRGCSSTRCRASSSTSSGSPTSARRWRRSGWARSTRAARGGSGSGADDPAHAEALLAAYFRPWGRAVAGLLDAGAAVLLDVHSYPRDPLPYERHAEGPRPPVCLGTDRAHTPSWLVAAAVTAFGGFEVGPGQPVLRRLRARGRVRRPRSWWRSAATSTPPGRRSWWRRWRRWSTR